MAPLVSLLSRAPFGGSASVATKGFLDPSVLRGGLTMSFRRCRPCNRSTWSEREPSTLCYTTYFVSDHRLVLVQGEVSGFADARNPVSGDYSTSALFLQITSASDGRKNRSNQFNVRHIRYGVRRSEERTPRQTPEFERILTLSTRLVGDPVHSLKQSGCEVRVRTKSSIATQACIRRAVKYSVSCFSHNGSVCGEVITTDHRLETFSDGNAEQAQSEVLTRAQRRRERERESFRGPPQH